MENNDEEEKGTKFIRQVYQMIYEYKFEELISLINDNYPTFANTNKNIIYILLKFTFIKLILHQHDFSAAKEFYSNHLLSIMKKIYGEKSNSFYKKHNKYLSFLNQINSSQTKYIYFQNHFKLENHLDKFMNLIQNQLEKRRRTDRNQGIFNIIKTKTNTNKDSSINISENNNRNNKVLFKTEHVNILIYSNENMSEIEDELFKLNLEESKKNIFNVQYANTETKNSINNDNIIERNEIESNIIDNINNSEEYNISYMTNSNASSYNEINSNKIKIKKVEEKRETSNLNSNQQKFNLSSKIRRVNLCKKIVRKFKKYLKKNIKEITYSFWTSFCREDYLPPFKKEEVEFKSFSQLYLNWLFSHQGGIELYNQFIRNSGEEELNKIYSNYNIQDPEDKSTIKNFFINFAIFFSNLKINEQRNNSINSNNPEIINNTMISKRFFSEPDFATNLFGNDCNYNNYNLRDEDEELSIGSINDIYKEERINNDEEKECVRENNNRNIDIENNYNNKMIESGDSSNSSMENINTNNNNININNNIIYKNHNSMKLNRYNLNPFSAANSHFDEFSINNFNKKYDNKINEISPDINMFEYDYENKINFSHESLYFLNKEINENEVEKKKKKFED